MEEFELAQADVEGLFGIMAHLLKESNLLVSQEVVKVISEMAQGWKKDTDQLRHEDYPAIAILILLAKSKESRLQDNIMIALEHLIDCVKLHEMVNHLE